MDDSVDDSRSSDKGQAEPENESGSVEPVEAEQPVQEPEPSLDDYVPV